MELKLYAGMILKRWRLVVAAFGVTLLLTAILVSRQPWVYEATSTYVLRPSPEFNEAADDFVRAMDTLSRHTDIGTTFSQVAGSKIIKERAIERLDLSGAERKDLQVNGAAIAGSNLLEITVRGPQPGVTRDMANAVGLETAIYMSDLYDVFLLEQLDEATLPSTPASPNKVLTLMVGAMLGLMLGVGLVFLGEYLQEPVPTEQTFNILDGESGFYNRAYFFSRLNQEISRAENSEHTFALTLIKLTSHRLATGVIETIPAAEAAQILLATLGPKLRNEDVLARVDGDLFALLLPAMSQAAADALLEPLEEQIQAYRSKQNGEDRALRGRGAITEVAAISLADASKHVQGNADALFEYASRKLAEEEREYSPQVTTSGEDVTGLLFLPKVEGDKEKNRKTPRKNGEKKAGR